jgi:M6 family metalloprotease-like protein/uncharacterized repeat protein (TIGR02543 family)
MIPFGIMAAEEGFILSELPSGYTGPDPIPLLVVVVSYDPNGNGVDDCKAGKSSTNKEADTYGEQWAYTTEDEWEKSVFGDEGKTIKNYYLNMSKGNFYFKPAKETYGKADNGIVYVTVNIPHPAASGEGDHPTRVKALAIVSEYVDFASYDTNGNGYLDYTELTISFIIAGYNTKWGSNSNGTQVWGTSNYQNAGSTGNIRVDGVVALNGLHGGRFTVDGECRNDLGKPNRIISIGTLTHELGHVLGAADLYTYSGYTYLGGPGDKALQGTGSNNYRAGEKSGDSPAAVDPYHLIEYGFEKSSVVYDGTYTLYSRETEEGYNIIRINTTNPDLYYLVENRYTEDPASYDGNIGSRDADDDGKHDVLNYGIMVWRVYQDVMDKYTLPNCSKNGAPDRAGLHPVYSGTDKKVVELVDCNTTIEILDDPGLEMRVKVTNTVQMPVEFGFSDSATTTDSISIEGLIKELNRGDVKTITGVIKTKSGEVVKTENVVFEKDGSFKHTFTGLTPDTSYVCEVSVEGTQEFSANKVSINVFTNPVVVEVTDRYTVTFFKNLTEKDSGYDIIVKTGEKISYSFPMRKSGYAFCGWYLDAEFTQPFDINNFTQDEAKSLSLYAKWVPSAEAATLKLSGATAENKVFSVTVGGTFIEPVVAEKEGFEFIGWFADEALTEKFDFSAPVTQTGNVTIYAGWKDLSAPAETTTDTVITTDPVTADPVDKDNTTLVVVIVSVVVVLAIASVVAVIIVKKKKN